MKRMSMIRSGALTLTTSLVLGLAISLGACGGLEDLPDPAGEEDTAGGGAGGDVQSRESSLMLDEDPKDGPPSWPVASSPTPDPLTPPPPSANPAGSFPLRILRVLLTQAGDDMLAKYDQAGTLRWNGEPPRSCAYSCNTAPSRAVAGQRFSLARSELKFRWSYLSGLVHRNITVPVRIQATCNGWEQGQGKLSVAVIPEQAVVSGGTLVEGVLNFFSAGHLSAYITGRVESSLAGASGNNVTLGSCRSLGVVSGYPTAPDYDAFVWDR